MSRKADGDELGRHRCAQAMHRTHTYQPNDRPLFTCPANNVLSLLFKIESPFHQYTVPRPTEIDWWNGLPPDPGMGLCRFRDPWFINRISALMNSCISGVLCILLETHRSKHAPSPISGIMCHSLWCVVVVVKVVIFVVAVAFLAVGVIVRT